MAVINYLYHRIKKDPKQMKLFIFIFFLYIPLTCQAQAILDVSRWMETLYEKNPQTRLRDIIIPGTHNSGTYKITKKSKLAPLERKFFKLSKKTVARWRKTQKDNIFTQLTHGIRHIDLRIQRDKKTFVIVHGLISVSLLSILKDLKKWAIKRPKEIVFIEFITDLSLKKDLKDLNKLVQKYLSSFLVHPFLPPSQLTFENIWVKQKNRPFLLFTSSSFKKLSPLYWDRNHNLKSLSTNTRNIENLMEQLLYGNSKAPGLYNQDNSKFYASELTFTPDTKTIAQGFFRKRAPKSLLQLMPPLFKAPAHFIKHWQSQNLNINIIKMDFYEKTNLVQSAIEANETAFK
jgi:hypothetical protein